MSEMTEPEVDEVEDGDSIERVVVEAAGYGHLFGPDPTQWPAFALRAMDGWIGAFLRKVRAEPKACAHCRPEYADCLNAGCFTAAVREVVTAAWALDAEYRPGAKADRMDYRVSVTAGLLHALHLALANLPRDLPMPTEPNAAAPAAERAMIERLARFMGWTPIESDGNYERIGLAVLRGGEPLAYWSEVWPPGLSVVPVEGGAPEDWNPLTDANADVQVLQRAREVWEWDVRLRSMAERLERTWADRARAAPDLYNVLAYQNGDYARAVDSVLTSIERGNE